LSSSSNILEWGSSESGKFSINIKFDWESNTFDRFGAETT